ncbi:MAG: DUF5677 domain-containing protein [Candidatus Omnitrophota bacterium]
MTNNKEKQASQKFLRRESERLSLRILRLLEAFNQKGLRLSQVAPHKRILLLFFTRAIKTFNAIRFLCEAGYGQDVSILLRSFLENLISTKYILSDPLSADQKAARFVGYKWVMLKRQRAEKPQSGLTQEQGEEADFINKQFAEFKQKNNIISDKALLTWSGRSIRDMARFSDQKLLDEYDKNFRTCSRFSHPSILGDDAYVQDAGDILKFSPLPSSSGVEGPLRSAIDYMEEFSLLFKTVFGLSETRTSARRQNKSRSPDPGGKKEHKDSRLFILSSPA